MSCVMSPALCGELPKSVVNVERNLCLHNAIVCLRRLLPMPHSLRPVFACIFDWLKTGHVHVMFLLFFAVAHVQCRCQFTCCFVSTASVWPGLNIIN